MDVLVIGGGNAGLCAAISAREQGASVVLLERAPFNMRGGNTRHIRNFRMMHNEPTETLPGTYTEEEFWQDLQRVTGSHTNEALARQMIRASYPMLDWYKRHGAYFQPSLKGTLALDRTNAFFLGGGCALLNAQYIAAQQRGVQIFYDCDVRQLEIDGSCFKAAVYQHAGCTRRISAKALVAACGGFQANSEWMSEVWGDAANNFLIRGTPYNEGHVLKSLLDQGVAAVGEADQCHAVAIDARAPKSDGGIVTRLDCVCFGIVINNKAQRFYDEGEDFWPKRYAIWGRMVAQQPGQIAYVIIDSKVADQFMPPVYPALRADSLPAMAAELEVPEQALMHTVQQFNAAVAPGNYDPSVLDGCATAGLTPVKSNWALPIDTPPYMAYPLRPGITFTYLGVEVDSRARMNMADGLPAQNLYAAGEIMAGNITGRGYCAGTGMTIGGVFGCIAGAEAACQRH